MSEMGLLGVMFLQLAAITISIICCFLILKIYVSIKSKQITIFEVGIPIILIIVSITLLICLEKICGVI
jgi:hypothetical protein